MPDLAFTRDWRFRTGLVAAVIALVGLALVQSQVLEPKFGGRSIAFSPKAFPYLTLGSMALLASLMVLGSMLDRKEPTTTPPGGALRARVLAPILIMACFVAIAEVIGLIIASVLSIAALAYVLGNRTPATILTLAITVPTFIWLVFKVGLKVFLPEGTLFEGFV